MHLTRMRLSGVPPFTEPVQFELDERVNVFVGPNASGKSTLLLMLADLLIGQEENAKRSVARGMGIHGFILVQDDGAEEAIEERMTRLGIANYVAGSQDWVGTKEEPKLRAEQAKPPAISIAAFREGLPGISEVEKWDANEDDADDMLQMPFTGSRTVRAYAALGAKLWSEEPSEEAPFARVWLMDAGKLADSCSKTICDEVIQDGESRNYIPNPYALGFLHHPQGSPENIKMLRMMGINTNDIRNFESLPQSEQPSAAAYQGFEDQPPIYLGHTSSGTEGTLLWIRWLALKMLCHYEFTEDWHEQPAILLIDEIENHLHPTWQRRVIPALLEHFPGLQIFATTHSPFVVAGLKSGQVHVLKRDANGVVTASTNEQDIIGWTTDEILRTFMGVDEPTDQLTIDRAQRLRELRGKDSLTDEETAEMEELRRQVNADFLSSVTPLGRERERLGDMMLDFLHSRQSELSQDGDQR